MLFAIKKKCFIVIIHLFLAVLFVSGVPKEYGEAQNELDRFACRLAQKYQMESLGTGTSMLLDHGKKVEWSIDLVDRRSLTIDQARPYVAGVIKDFLQKITTDPLFERYLKYAAKHSSKVDSRSKTQLIGVKIGFWNENVDRPLFPYLAQIQVGEEKVFYYYADPTTQALQKTPVTESFDSLFGKSSGE